jgi:hypothetical protein
MDISLETSKNWFEFSLGLMKRVEEIEVRPFSGREEYELMLDYF